MTEERKTENRPLDSAIWKFLTTLSKNSQRFRRVMKKEKQADEKALLESSDIKYTSKCGIA